MTRRPAGAEPRLGGGDRRCTTLSLSSGRPPLKRTLRSTCGSGSKRWQTSLAGLPSFLTIASTCMRRDEAVAGRRIVGQDHVAGLLAADVVALLDHALEHVAVADRGALQRQAEAGEMALEAEIRHDGRDDAGLRRAARRRASSRR